MYIQCSELARRAGGNLMLAAATVLLAVAAHAEALAADGPSTVGRIDFEAAKLPEANVEIDLSQDMFKSLFGIGDAAITGVAESLVKSTGSADGAKGGAIGGRPVGSGSKNLATCGQCRA